MYIYIYFFYLKLSTYHIGIINLNKFRWTPLKAMNGI